MKPEPPELKKEEPWAFKPRFRRRAFGWKSQVPIQRLKEAVAEIHKAARRDPLRGAEGAVLLLGATDLEAAEEAAQRLRSRWDRAFSPGFVGRAAFLA